VSANPRLIANGVSAFLFAAGQAGAGFLRSENSVDQSQEVKTVLRPSFGELLLLCMWTSVAALFVYIGYDSAWVIAYTGSFQCKRRPGCLMVGGAGP
jgi:hypothetical protein